MPDRKTRTRRQFLCAAAALAAGAPVLQACSASGADYDGVVRETWRHTRGQVAGRSALARELVRYATLAASSHNTQCWKFRLEADAIAILPDLSRRCPAVDPDDHHLFASLGCAAENLVQAALANGLHGDVRFDATDGGAVRIALAPTRPAASPLFAAIPARQCTRAEYDGRSLPPAQLRRLEAAGRGNGVDVLLLTDAARKETVLDYVTRGNAAQIADDAFMEELERWIRFSAEEAVARSDGLFSRSSGNPAVPRWLGRRLFRRMFTAGRENDKYARQVRSSAGIAVFVSGTDDRAHWVEAGRCYERFALQAAALGVRSAFLNQPVEVPQLRPQFASALGLARRRPDLVVRFGHGPEMPRSLRRPVFDVLVE